VTARASVRTVAELSAREARAIAITAQGLAAPRLTSVGRDELRGMIDRLGVVQIDSVNVLARSHYLPAWSRLGGYDPAELDRMTHAAPRALFEYWGHEASLLPVASQPLFRWRMARAKEHAWNQIRTMGARPAFVRKVLAWVTERGPVRAGELEVKAPRRAGWWEWSDVKRAIEWLFWTGQVTSAGRRGFERLYDLPERVLPASVLAAPTPSEPEALRQLIEHAGRALGVATEGDLRDYFRLKPAVARPAIAAVVESGVLQAVRVEGWAKLGFLHREAVGSPLDPARAALLSPFDSLVWSRDRTERMFGMRYRLEIYTPQPRRVHGYYVLPFLLGDALVARIDLKADREAHVLRVQAAHAEPRAPRTTAAALATELTAMAGWLGLEQVEVELRGELAPKLRAALARSRRSASR
jgi:uncharacterized protein YcaQ